MNHLNELLGRFKEELGSALHQELEEALAKRPMRRQEAAEYLRISLRTLDKILRTKMIPYTDIGGTILITRGDIDKALEERKTRRKEFDL